MARILRVKKGNKKGGFFTDKKGGFFTKVKILKREDDLMVKKCK